MDLPKVSVIVLNYNGLEHLETCFRSLEQLEYPPEKLELVLVDNSSTDGSVEYMRARFPEVRLICNDRNYGFAEGNNIGARQARGEILAFLNNDMRVTPNWLTELVKPLLEDKEIVCTSSKILNWDGKYIDFGGSGLTFNGYGCQVGWGEPPHKHSSDKPIIAPCGGAMAIRRDVFLEAGGFDEDYFAYYEDVDLGWRLWILGYKVRYAAKSIVYHVHHGSLGKAAEEKRRVLYERNALYTIIKNYEENLQRILPAVLLLLAYRTYIAASPDLSWYRAEPRAVAPTLYIPVPLHLSQSYYGSLGTKAWRTLRQSGWRTFFKKVKERLQAYWKTTRTRWQKPRSYDGINIYIPRQAVSYLIAADDFLRNYPRLLEKRRQIQAARKRPDREIFPLFITPLAPCSGNPEYVKIHESLVKAFGIDRIFEDSL